MQSVLSKMRWVTVPTKEEYFIGLIKLHLELLPENCDLHTKALD